MLKEFNVVVDYSKPTRRVFIKAKGLVINYREGGLQTGTTGGGGGGQVKFYPYYKRLCRMVSFSEVIRICSVKSVGGNGNRTRDPSHTRRRRKRQSMLGVYNR